MKKLFLLPLVTLMACGSGHEQSEAAKTEITEKYLPALETTQEYRTRFLESQRNIATWVTIISEKGVSEKTELKNFVETGYKTMHDKLKKQFEPLPEELKKKSNAILVSSDSLVTYYAMVMNTFNGIDAFLDPELSRAAQDMVFLKEGEVKSWHAKLDGQLKDLEKQIGNSISEKLSEKK